MIATTTITVATSAKIIPIRNNIKDSDELLDGVPFSEKGVVCVLTSTVGEGVG